MDAAIEHLQRRDARPLFVPVTMLNDLQSHVQDVEDALCAVKDDSRNRWCADGTVGCTCAACGEHGPNVQTDEHMNNVQHSLDTIEQLQRYQIDMIQQQVQYNTAHHYAHNDDVYTWMRMLPKMSEQYSFTVNLIRRVRDVWALRTPLYSCTQCAINCIVAIAIS